jgi:hypothetical protein
MNRILQVQSNVFFPQLQVSETPSFFLVDQTDDTTQSTANCVSSVFSQLRITSPD